MRATRPPPVALRKRTVAPMRRSVFVFIVGSYRKKELEEVLHGVVDDP